MNINNCSFLLESDRISYVLVCILHSTYLYMVCRINIVLYNYIMKQFVCLFRVFHLFKNECSCLAAVGHKN